MELLLYLFLALVILPELVPDDLPLMGSNPVLKRSLNIVCPNKTRCAELAKEKVKDKLGNLGASTGVNKTISTGGFSEIMNFRDTSIWSYGLIRLVKHAQSTQR